MLFGTVGVAPGSYTFNQGGQLLGPACVDDVNGPYGYGQPARGWYDAATNWYEAQFLNATPQLACGGLPTVSAPANAVMLDPYGTDSTLRGRSLADVATVGGVRLDVLGIAAGVIIGLGFLVHHIAKPRRRR